MGDSFTFTAVPVNLSKMDFHFPFTRFYPFSATRIFGVPESFLIGKFFQKSSRTSAECHESHCIYYKIINKVGNFIPAYEHTTSNKHKIHRIGK